MKAPTIFLAAALLCSTGSANVCESGDAKKPLSFRPIGLVKELTQIGGSNPPAGYRPLANSNVEERRFRLLGNIVDESTGSTQALLYTSDVWYKKPGELSTRVAKYFLTDLGGNVLFEMLAVSGNEFVLSNASSEHVASLLLSGPQSLELSLQVNGHARPYTIDYSSIFRNVRNNSWWFGYAANLSAESSLGRLFDVAVTVSTKNPRYVQRSYRIEEARFSPESHGVSVCVQVLATGLVGSIVSGVR